MRDASEALDAYLLHRFGITLERALSNATAGVVTLALAGKVEVTCDPIGSFIYDDVGMSERYQGLLTVEGVTYRFQCSVFTDGGGERYLEDVGEFRIEQWEATFSLPR